MGARGGHRPDLVMAGGGRQRRGSCIEDRRKGELRNVIREREKAFATRRYRHVNDRRAFMIYCDNGYDGESVRKRQHARDPLRPPVI
ncbi:hypothetical protein CDAR_207211 [Caerostris darwini]|uniref:Uncharacterized protein n=1 Tax=Caerostris darwini TaxID=1538125 RepID=A0AAV4SPJ1_9ARAC|nr:hypothetical protein CDAR_207211 [Caerostris darwini]